MTDNNKSVEEKRMVRLVCRLDEQQCQQECEHKDDRRKCKYVDSHLVDEKENNVTETEKLVTKINQLEYELNETSKLRDVYAAKIVRQNAIIEELRDELMGMTYNADQYSERIKELHRELESKISPNTIDWLGLELAFSDYVFTGALGQIKNAPQHFSWFKTNLPNHLK